MIHFPRRHTSAIRRFDVDFPDVFMFAHRSKDMLSCTNMSPNLEIVSPLQDISAPVLASEGKVRVAIRYDCFSISQNNKLCIHIEAMGPSEFGEILNTCLDNIDSNEYTEVTQSGNIWRIDISGLTNPGKYSLNAELRTHDELQSPKKQVMFDVIN